MRTHLARLASLALAAGCWLASPPAVADSAADKAAADALFEQGRTLAEAGRYADACPKFEESQRLDPGLGTALNLADCYERTGRVASAWGLFNATARAAAKRGDTKRADEAAKRAAILGPQLAKLAIVVPPATRIPGLEVRKDGELVGEGQWGSPLPADAGTHTIAASAPSHKTWSTVVRIETNGSAASVEIPALDVLDVPSGDVPAPFWTPGRTVGVVVGGAGLGVGAVLVAVFGGLAASKKSAASPHCSTGGGVTVCDPVGLSLRGDAKTLADTADVGLAVGGAALVTGVVLFATAPAADAGKPASTGLRVRPVLGLHGSGLTVEGRW